MKTSILTVLILLFYTFSHAQLVQGELKINDKNKTEINLKSNKIVNLYADFREKTHQINFVFTGIDLPQNNEKQEVIQFVFNTTIKKDGKILGSMKRSPTPFFPGDMLMPVETFDLISILSNIQTNTNDKVSEIPKGNYEVILEAKPIGVKGEIKAGIIWFKI
jgi:hypothetical protein